jgi:hypothetical protein
VFAMGLIHMDREDLVLLAADMRYLRALDER